MAVNVLLNVNHKTTNIALKWKGNFVGKSLNSHWAFKSLKPFKCEIFYSYYRQRLQLNNKTHYLTKWPDYVFFTETNLV